jgi:hypothetical protein
MQLLQTILELEAVQVRQLGMADDPVGHTVVVARTISVKPITQVQNLEISIIII